MELIRDKDVIFEDSNLENLFKLENFPVFMGCMDNMNPQDDLYEDFILDISKTNGIVQVRNLIELEVLYDSEHSSGTVGKSGSAWIAKTFRACKRGTWCCLPMQ